MKTECEVLNYFKNQKEEGQKFVGEYAKKQFNDLLHSVYFGRNDIIYTKSHTIIILILTM